MYRITLLIFAFVGFSVCGPGDDGSKSTIKLSELISQNSNSTFIPIERHNGNADADKRTNKNNPGSRSSEYFFLSDASGKVIIMDAVNYKIITTYDLPEISKSNLAIVGDKFYNIDTLAGVIYSTSIDNIMSGPSSIVWNSVGLFPNKTDWTRNGVAVNETYIYFATHGGAVYLFDTATETVSNIGSICEYSNYASLAIVNNVLYIHKCYYFFSYDGNKITELVSPDRRYDAGLFRFEDSICRVGANSSDEYPDPVRCIGTKGGHIWEIMSYINEARARLGVVTVGSKTYLFGGEAAYNSGYPPNFWRTSVEVFDSETKTWNYIPSPYSTVPEFPQAIFFSF